MKQRIFALSLTAVVVLLVAGYHFWKTPDAHAVAPTGTSATIQSAGVSAVQILLSGSDFDTFVHSGTTVADADDLAKISYNGMNPTTGEVTAATVVTFRFPIAMGTGKSGGNFVVSAGALQDAGMTPNAEISIADGSINDFAAPLFLSQVITAPTEITITYSESVITSLGHYTGLDGDLAGNTLTGISGSGTDTIVLTLGTPVATDASGIIDISGAVRDSNFNLLGIGVGVNQAVTDGQMPTLEGTPEITDSTTATITYSEAVTTVAGDYTDFGGDLAGGTVTGISGSGTDTIVLTFGGITLGTGATGTLDIGSGVEDLVGNALAPVNDQVVADGQAPLVASVSPTDGSTGQSQALDIVIVFSESMDTGSVAVSSDKAYAYDKTWSSGNTTLTLSHPQSFAYETIAVQITSGTDTNGTSVSSLPYQWSFRTLPTASGSGGGSSIVPGMEDIQKAAGQVPAPVSVSAAPCVPYMTKYARLGETGSDITALHRFLIHGGWLAIPAPTGYFGTLTRAAVVALQEAFSPDILVPLDLTAGTGFVGPYTVKKINALVCEAAPPFTDFR